MSDFIVSDYSIIESGDPQSIVETMHNAIAKKWEPIGGIAVTVGVDGKRWYTQALVQYEEEEVHIELEGLPEECRACPLKDDCPVA